MQRFTAAALLISLTSCANWEVNNQTGLYFQKETQGICVYSSTVHDSVGIPKTQLVEQAESCPRSITLVCEAYKQQSRYADRNGETVMLTAYTCNRRLVNDKEVHIVRPPESLK